VICTPNCQSYLTAHTVTLRNLAAFVQFSFMSLVQRCQSRSPSKIPRRHAVLLILNHDDREGWIISWVQQTNYFVVRECKYSATDRAFCDLNYCCYLWICNSQWYRRFNSFRNTRKEEHLSYQIFKSTNRYLNSFHISNRLINKFRKMIYSFCLMVEASDHGYVLHMRRIHVTRYRIRYDMI
jgi:hypothetical protein